MQCALFAIVRKLYMASLSFEKFLADIFAALFKLPEPIKRAEAKPTPGQAFTVWHKETGLIVSEDLTKPNVYCVYCPDPEHVPCANLMMKNHSKIDYSQTFRGFLVGHMANISGDWKVTFYANTPQKFKTYVANTIKQNTGVY